MVEVVADGARVTVGECRWDAPEGIVLPPSGLLSTQAVAPTSRAPRVGQSGQRCPTPTEKRSLFSPDVTRSSRHRGRSVR